LPPLREEEAIAGAVLQRLTVQRDALTDQENRARQMIETLTGRISQLVRDMEREAGLNRDAVETIARLDWEQAQIAKASEGHDARLGEAAEAAAEAAQVLQDREAALTELTEDVARLAARHQSAQRLLTDNRATADKSDSEAGRAAQAATDAETALARAADDFAAAEETQAAAQEAADAAEEALIQAEEARATIQTRELHRPGRPIRGRRRGGRTARRSGRAGPAGRARNRDRQTAFGPGAGGQGFRGRIGRSLGR